MKQKLKIGEFSKLMQVTVKTLRHYEQRGLLVPDEVDDASGYRFYSLSQMQRLGSIRTLKDLGFSLEEIKDIFEEQNHMPDIDQLTGKIQQCEADIRMLQRRRERLVNVLNSQKHLKEMDKFTIETLPAIIVASHRETIENYEALGMMCVNVIGPEMQRLGCKCPPPGYCFTIDHNEEYSPTGVDIEYCEQVEEMGEDSAIIQFKQFDEVPTAICMKHYGPYDRFYQSYTLLYKYIEEQGYAISGHARYVYVDGIWNQDDPEKWLSIIQVPVRKA
ncbi:MAG: MerR family transcriptional regulator [Bacteroidales bacterium]|nr:MerR family transcriptional regulator [Bacteroidales bacterium]